MKEVKSKAELETLVSQGSPVTLHFWASWCDASKQMDQVFSHLSTDFPHAHFLKVIPDSTMFFLFIHLFTFLVQPFKSIAIFFIYSILWLNADYVC